MKRIYGFVLAAMATAVAASCSQKLNDDAADVNAGTSGLVSMTFNALNDAAEDVVSKTHGAGRNVYWDEGDEITVFSVGDEVIKQGFTATSITKNADGNGVQATFSGLVSPAAETFYAIYPHAEGNAYEDGTFTATIPAEQVGKPNGFLSGANVSVAVSHKDGENADVLQFKNLSAVIYFKFATAEDAANTKSVTLKARKSEDDASAPEFWGLAGEVKFTLDDDNLPVVQEGTVDHVTLLPPEGGFVAGQNYIIPVCPVGDCKGMQIVFTDLNGQTYVKNNNTDFKLQRNIMFNNGGVPEPYVVPFPEQDFEVVLNFAEKWPFNESCKPLAEQVSKQYDSYTFTYEYEYKGVATSKILNLRMYWGVYSGDLGYEYVDGETSYLLMKTGVDNKNNAGNNGTVYLHLPAIEERYLKSVTISNLGRRMDLLDVSGDPILILCKETTSLSGNTTVESNSDYTFSFPIKDKESEMGVSYSIRSRCANLMISKVVATYSKTKPE